MSLQELLKLSDYDVGSIAAAIVISLMYYYLGIFEIVNDSKKYEKWCIRLDKIRIFMFGKGYKK
jgi:hypothetical protein